MIGAAELHPCERFKRAMARYRPRFRGDIENERSGRPFLVLAPPTARCLVLGQASIGQ